MYNKIAKFLKIFFLCHCRPERSFFYKGKQFPICARCTGELIGLIVGIPIIFKLKDVDIIYIFLLSIPLILDGGIQLVTKYESNNIKRVIKGFLFGIALIFILAKVHWSAFENALRVINIFQPDNPLLEKYRYLIE